ncbi:MAG TPA: hypothetical protein VF014_10680 [Casimicrobiaceae bacterium]|nr:hypothetical protein [Casimicrobiaceae bacterium]
MAVGLGPAADPRPYDVCLCEISPNELLELPALYYKVREHVSDGGTVLVQSFNPTPERLGIAQFALYELVFPVVDQSQIRFFGTVLTARLRAGYLRVARSYPTEPARSLLLGMTLIGLVPLCWIANRLAARRDPNRYSPHWTSALLEFSVRRKT